MARPRPCAAAVHSDHRLTDVASFSLIASLDGVATNDNLTRIDAALRAGGFRVEVFDHQAVRLDDGAVIADSANGRFDLATFDRIWLFGFGPGASFLDRMQILRSLPREVFVNHPDALVNLHGKISLRSIAGIPTIPGILTSDPAELASRVESGGEWILKPPAGSFGRDVYRLNAADSNKLAIIESMTRDGRYALLERFVAAPGTIEKRVLLAGGRVIGAYGKRRMDHRGNLDAGMSAEETNLSGEEHALLDRVGKALADRGALFAAIDLIHPYVIEANVANPGFLSTYERLSGANLAASVVDALCASRPA